MDLDKKYFEGLANCISSDDKVIKSFKKAVNCIDNPDTFICDANHDFDKNPKGYMDEVVGSIMIVIDPDTVLDIGEERTKLKRIDKVFKDYDREPVKFCIAQAFHGYYMDNGFFNYGNEPGDLEFDFEDGEIADEISDITGYLVDSVSYHFEV